MQCDEGYRLQEKAIYEIGNIFATRKDGEALVKLMKDIRIIEIHPQKLKVFLDFFLD